MFECDHDLIAKFHKSSGHSVNSIKAYQTVFNKYRDFHKLSLSKLLDEAIEEQEKNVSTNKLSIYNRILLFRESLVERYNVNTINSSISKIKTFYHYNRVNIPFIPPLNAKSVKKHECISFGDLLTKDEIIKALDVADDDLVMWVMVMISSGCSRAEAKSMTNQTFFEGTHEYHKKDDFAEALKYLSRKDNVVCTCKLIRLKTDKPYYTFLTPECVQKIAKIKLKRGDFDLESPLLNYSVNYVNAKCKFLNDALNFGYAGGFSRFRPHMFRKFNATSLYQGSLTHNYKLNMDEVDCLHGRGKNQTRQAYFKDNPDFLKLEYVKAMNNVSLYNKYHWEIVDDEIVVFASRLKA